MMKRIIAFVCVLALLLSTPIASVEAASASDTYDVGFSKVDITPSSTGLPLGGYGDQSTRVSNGALTPQILKETLTTKATNVGWWNDYTKYQKLNALADAIPNDADENMYHLYASCVAITDKTGTTMLMLSLDANDCPDSLSASLRKSITKATGVPDENITITATHTHSAPDLSKAGSAAFVATLNDYLASCALEAIKNQEPATMWQNTVEVPDMNFVRHYIASATDTDAYGEPHVKGSNFGSQYGTETAHVKDADNDMHLLMFEFADGSKKDDIVVCNWRAHPCQDSSDSLYDSEDITDQNVYRAISSDYIGSMRSILKAEGYDLLFLQGAAGNIGTGSKLDDTLKSSYTYGTELAQELLTGISGMAQVDTGLIQTDRVYMQTENVQYTSSDLQYAKKVQTFYNDLTADGDLDDTTLIEGSTYQYWNGTSYDSKYVSDYYTTSFNDDGKIDQNEAHDLANTLAWAKGYGSRYHINNIVENASSTGSTSLQVNAITLGSDIAFVTAPVELFDTYTADLKSYYGKRTFVMGYTNGFSGYLPDDDAFEYNATQTDSGMVFGGSYEVHTTDFAKGTGEQVAQTMKTMLNDLRDPSYCPCVGTHTDSTQCKEVTWAPWVDENGAPITDSLPDSGNYYLLEDVTVPSTTELQGTLNLDLSGKTVKGANGIFTMATGDHLVVTDSYADGQLGVSGIPITANAGSKLTVYAGTIGGTIKNKGATVTLWGTPSLYINMASNASAMNCQGLQTGASIYVAGAYDRCFAKVSSAAQRDCFKVPNSYNIRYEDGGLYMTSRESHCVCAGSLSGGVHGHKCDNTLEWQAWTSTDSLPTETGNYYLTADVYLSSEQEIAADTTVRLDLNGKTVYVGQVRDDNDDLVLSDSGIRALYIPSGSTLELTNSNPNSVGTLDGSACAPTTRDSYGGVIYAAGTLNLYSNITIKGNRSGEAGQTPTAVKGGCVYSLGSMTMYGGTITSGSVSGSGRAGGNVYTSGTFTMYGGEISNGAGNGLNLYIYGQANATIGGTSYIYGGIVVASSKASLTLTGSPNIPKYVYTGGSNAGISFYSNNAINATGLDAATMNEQKHIINFKDGNDRTTTFATVNSPAQANCFESFDSTYGVHYNKNSTDNTKYDVALYDSSSGTRYGCICGGKLVDSDDHTCSILTWSPLTGTTLPSSGNYYLTSPVTVDSGYTVSGELNLDLHGQTVTAEGTQWVYKVSGSSAKLRITDSRTNGTIDATSAQCSGSTYENGGMVYVDKGTFELYGGTLLGGSSFKRGGVIYATGATVNMYGGTITGETTSSGFGGGLALYGQSTFTMYGGTITDCTSHAGGGIAINESTMYLKEGAQVCDNRATLGTSSSATGGNIRVAGTSTKPGTLHLEGGKVSGGSSSGLGDNIAIASGGKVIMTSGTVCDPAEDYNIGLYEGGAIEVSGGQIYGGTYGIYSSTENGGVITLANNAYVSGNTYGIYINDSYAKVRDTLKVKQNFTGTAHVYWGTATADYLGIAIGNEIGNTVSNGYTGTGTLICDNLGVPLVGSSGGKLIPATVAIANGNGVQSYHPTFENALSYYELKDSTDQEFIQLYANLEDEKITESVFLDLNGHDLSVASVDSGCMIYGMDSVTNQYTHYAADGTNISGKLTLPDGSNAEEIIKKDVHVNLTKGTTKGTRKYLALENTGDDAGYSFHRYYLSLHEVGLRPNNTAGTAGPGIFYNAVFYGDEAVAEAVDAYGVEVSSVDTFAEDYTRISDYQSTLGAFQSGVLGNKGYRTVITGILSKNGVEPVEDYSEQLIYGRAYINVDGTTLLSTNTGSTNLRSIIATADAAYGKNGLSTAQKNALDAMYDQYSTIMKKWDLQNIGSIEINIDDFFRPDPKDDGVLNILMVGNSFCYYYVQELYDLLMEAELEGVEEVQIYNLYESGCKLSEHLEWWLNDSNGDGYQLYRTNKDGRKDLSPSKEWTLEKALAQADWDYISIQASRSELDYINGDHDALCEQIKPSAEPLLERINDLFPKAQLLWHRTWFFEVGYVNNGYTYTEEDGPKYEAGIQAVSDYMCNEFDQDKPYDLQMVNTGAAWTEARKLNETAKLLPTGGLCARTGQNSFDTSTPNSGDGYHDGDIGGGQLLNAYIWYMTITGDNNLSKVSNYAPGSGNLANYTLEADHIAMLQEAAIASFNAN